MSSCIERGRYWLGIPIITVEGPSVVVPRNDLVRPHDPSLVLGLLFPPICMSCGLLLRHHPPLELCTVCTSQVTPLPPTPDPVQASFAYDGPLALALARLKFGRDLTLAGPLGRALALHPIFTEPTWDLAIGVPLHPLRRLARGFDQVGLLCEYAFGVHRGLADRLRFDVLRRIRATASQATLPAAQRRTNVDGAFAVRSRRADAVRGRSVLVIDDVTTTGATLKACADALRGAGAVRVDALALLRTVA